MFVFFSHRPRHLPRSAPGVRALPALTLTDAAKISLPEPEEGDDSGLRWGVAGVVSAIPLVGFTSFLLPAMGLDEDDPTDAADAARLKLLSGTFAVASLTMGLNLGSAGAWGVVAATAATLQLERLARDSREIEASAARNAATAERRARTKELNAEKARTVSAAVERAGRLQLAKEEKEEEGTPGVVKRNPLWNALTGTKAGNQSETDARDSWAAVSDPLGRLPSVVRPPSVPGPPDLTVKQLGRALGAAQVNATRLRGEIEEGKLRARLDAECEDEMERLELERRFQSSEIEAWDRRFEVRTATREQLMAIARERGMRGYSKLRRAELLEAVERELYGEQEEDLSP